MKKKITNCTYLGELPRWFLTKAIDFVAQEAPSQRYHKANSQCHKLLAWLCAGNQLTSLKAIELCGGTEAPRRIRNLRKTLEAHGLALFDRWEENATSRYKVYHIAEWDLEQAKRLLAQ